MYTASGATYSVYLCDPYGVRLADASAFVSLKYTRVVNNSSTAILILPSDFDTSLIRIPDGRMEIWRKVPGSSREVLDTETTWLIKKLRYDQDDHGKVAIRVEADTPLCILRDPGKFVDISALADPTFSDPLDDAMKNLVLQNAGSFATAARDLTTYLTVAPYLSRAPTVTKTFPWRDVLKTLQELGAASAQEGTYLAFDIVAPTPDTLQFRTYTGQRGVDHRFPSGINPVLIGPAFGNVGACYLELDYRNEVTYALAGGKGELTARLTGSAQDTTRIGASPFGRREHFVNAASYDTTTGLAGEAEAAVRAGRPRSIFQGKLIDTPDTRYGVHWGWGDFVTVQAFGQSFDCRIEAITVTVERGKETIDVTLRNDA